MRAGIIMRVLALLYVGIIMQSCQDSVLSGIRSETTSGIRFGTVAKLGPNSAGFIWTCSDAADGFLIGPQGILPSLKTSKTHYMEIQGLVPQTEYQVILTCQKPDPSLGIPLSFRTWVSETPEKTQGIWILGGMGSDGNPSPQIDLYDGNSEIWFPAVTSVPSPRAFASILSHKSKIYVIGGLEKSGSVYSVSVKVEAYDPYNDSWETKADLPQAAQGAIAASVGDEIYILSGSASTTISNSPLFNTILKFHPEIGVQGQWSSYSSISTIFPRTDMAGCGIDGVLYYAGGRLSNNGTLAAGTDGFIPTANTVTGTGEPSLNVARFGSASVCVNPEPKDPFPSDKQWFGVIGGSTANDVQQPVLTLSPSNLTDFHEPGSSSFLSNSSSQLPTALYYPAAETSYETRKILLFGGADALNHPLDAVYSIDSADPVNSTWTISSGKMPRARFGHTALRIDR